jgi:hypothetical protein
MKVARLLVWMISLVALVAPSGMTVHATTPAPPAASVDYADHASPDPCPDHGTAKHAAGECCSLMTCSAVALLPPSVDIESPTAFHLSPPQRTPARAGRIVTKDPPPPRV